MPSSPLYPFGYGLSYTEFEYGKVNVAGEPGTGEPMPISMTGKEMEDNLVEVTLTVSNVGDRDGDEVVQLYLTDLKASVARPQKQLRAFRRVHIRAGESESVTFELKKSDFAMFDREMNYIVEPGEFKISVGASSSDIRRDCIVKLSN